MKVLQPKTTAEALQMLAEDTSLIPIAGGTDLLVHWPTRPREHDRNYVDLSGLGELKGLRWSDGHLVLGALATYWDVITDARAGEQR